VCVISLIASGSGRWKLRKLVIVITLFEKLENYIGAKVKKPKERETTCASLLSLQFSSVLFPTRLSSVLSAPFRAAAAAQHIHVYIA
jgi:hypothetical protein